MGENNCLTLYSIYVYQLVLIGRNDQCPSQFFYYQLLGTVKLLQRIIPSVKVLRRPYPLL